MPSQFFGLNIAYTGLLASNAALNTTSNNIANVQTEGYSRQKVDQQAYSALRVFQTYGCAGAGVETLAIERVRDEFYDFRYWNNNARVGEYSQKQYYMQQIETYFDDNGKNAGFKTVFDQLMVTGMQALLNDPDDATAKAQFVGYAGALAEYFNGLAGNMEKLQKDVNQEIKLKVDEMNSLAGEIATLNKQINTIELTGQKANELRDRRTLLLDQLSEIVDIDVKEIPIIDSSDPTRETGAHRFIIKIASGQILVDGNEYNGLECVARKDYEKVNQTDIDGLYDVYWENGQKFNLYNAAMGGALKGLVEMRDGNNGENFTGEITEVGTANGGANDTVTVRVDRAYLKDLNKCNLSDQGGVIRLGNQEFYYDSWECSISRDENGEEVYSYKFTLSAEREKNPARITNDRVGRPATIGTALNYQGIPYYMNQMNEWVRTFAQKFNDILTRGVASGNEPGIHMFTGNIPTDDAQYEFPTEARYDLFLKGQELLKQAYEQAPETLVLEKAAEPILNDLKATAGYANDLADAKQKKLDVKRAAKLDQKIAEKMSEQGVKNEITARVAAIMSTTGNTLTQAQARQKVTAEVEQEYRNGTNGKTAITLTAAEENDIDAEATSEATAEVDAKYKKQAMEEARDALQDAGKLDAAVEEAKQAIVDGTPEGKAALEQAKKDIARENEIPVEILDMVDELADKKRQEITAELAANGNPNNLTAEDILKQALDTVELTVNDKEDSYYQLTAGNFDILAAMELDPSRLANRYKSSDGVEQNDLLEDVRDLATDKNAASFRGASASEFLQCVLSDIALNAQRANTFHQSFTDIAGSIDTQRLSISGVDEDEEAVNLVKYQNGYNLASKMIQTLTEIYDKLILETGV